MHFNPYGGSAAQAAVTLVNAESPGPGELVRLLRAAGMSLSRLDTEQTAAALAWGERLAAVFHESDVDRRVELVNRLLADSVCRPYVSRHDGLPAHLHYAGEHTDAVTRLRAYTAGGLAHLLCDDPDRLGHCARAGCPVVFVDVSRNGRRRYCDTRCATRVHVAEHRERAAG